MQRKVTVVLLKLVNGVDLTLSVAGLLSNICVSGAGVNTSFSLLPSPGRGFVMSMAGDLAVFASASSAVNPVITLMASSSASTCAPCMQMM